MVGTLRQSVKLAVQLFSNTISKDLHYCGENKFIENNNWEKIKNYYVVLIVFSL